MDLTRPEVKSQHGINQALPRSSMADWCKEDAAVLAARDPPEEAALPPRVSPEGAPGRPLSCGHAWSGSPWRIEVYTRSSRTPFDAESESSPFDALRHRSRLFASRAQ